MFPFFGNKRVLGITISLQNDQLLGHSFSVELHLTISKFMEKKDEISVGLRSVDFVNIFLLEPFENFF